MGRKIVIAVDKSDDAAKMFSWAKVKLFTKEDHIIALYCTPERSMFNLGGITFEGSWEKIQSEEIKIANETLRKMRIEADELGVPISTETSPGNASDIIPEYCKTVGAELLVMGRESQQGFFAGPSVSAHCIAHAPCPVLVIRSGTI